MRLHKYFPLCLFTGLLFCTGTLFAQNVPVAIQPVSAVPVSIPATYTKASGNYVRSWVPNQPFTSVALVQSSSNTLQQVVQHTTYTDGLARPLQTVDKGISPAGNDVVSPVTYNSFGLTAYNYLPYVQSGSSDGNFKTDPFNSQHTFYQNATLNPGLTGETIYYNQTQYEVSPLNRELKAFSAGNSWAAEGGSKPVEVRYGSNITTNYIRRWDIPANGLAPVSSAFYDPGQLSLKSTIDEQGHRTDEFTDKDGHLILRKVSLTTTADDHSGWLCTYYVYDNLGNLRCVIPPKAVESIKATWVIPIGVYDELCFRYTYDGRNRLVTKKMPGAALQEMAYDVRDRLVFSRDGNLRSLGQWRVTFYDVLNRPVQTSIYTDTSSLTTLQNQLTSTAVLNPSLSASALAPQSYTFYDDYTYTGVKAAVTSEFSKPQAGSNPYSESNTATSTLTNGLVTGNKILVLGTTQWLTTSIYYNDKGRVIQTVSDNLQGGQVTNTSMYDFSGKVLSTYLHQTDPHSTVTADTRVLTNMAYDPAGRMLNITKTVNDDATTTRVIVQNSYDELGRLKKASIGNNIDNATYEYNIRGWLNSVNKAYLDGSNGDVNHFGEILSYNNGFTQQQYNGNIAGIKWRGFSDGLPRAYGFSYDNSNRLTQADFNQQNSLGAGWTVDKVNYSVSNLVYDPNGNINSLKQMGLQGASIIPIDQLNYKYLANSNKLTAVTDTVQNPGSTLGDFKEPAVNFANNQTGVPDYSYDVNGNLVTDVNKGITYNAYNYLNLPIRIQINGKGRIAYLYDANGNKLRKTVSDSTVTPAKVTVTDYIAGMVYQNDTLQLISHEQGRIRVLLTTGQPVKYVYDYFVKDHLGDVREVLTEKRDTAVYAATMETAMSAKENALFSNIDNTRQPLPAGYPTDNTTNPNAYVATLNSNGQKIGPSLVLRVMAGDTISIATSAFYKSTGTSTRSNFGTQMVSAVLQAFSGGVVNDGPHAGTGSLSPIATNLDTATYNQLVQNNPNWATNPKAYLNYVIFDDQFNLVSNSGVKQVQATPNVLQQLVSGALVMKKTGFIYIYTSNESAQDVNFDNLVVAQMSGPLLEETHYYPFGLTMAGISSHAMGKLDNRYKYNGIELDTALGLNEYEAHFRDLDPQIGRWWQIDPKVDQGMESISPYASMYDDPCRFTDFMGDDPGGPGDIFQTAWKGLNQGVDWVNIYVNPLTPIAEGITGASYESHFTASKPRSQSISELALFLLPELKPEGIAMKMEAQAATAAAEKSVVSLDNNALTHAVENGGKDDVQKAIGGAIPIVSKTAAKEFLVKGSKDALKDYMKEIGATISKASASSTEVKSLQEAAERMGRKLGGNDAKIAIDAMKNNAAIITRDKKFYNFLSSFGWSVKKF